MDFGPATKAEQGIVVKFTISIDYTNKNHRCQYIKANFYGTLENIILNEIQVDFCQDLNYNIHKHKPRLFERKKIHENI